MWRKNLIWRCCCSKKICRWWWRFWQLIWPKILWKNFGGGGGGRLLLLLILLPSGLNVSSSLYLFSLDLNSMSIMSSAPFKILLRSFFLPISISFIKLPITEFCASKCFKSLNKNSIEFWFLMTFLEIGSSFLLKLALFNFPSVS